METYTPCLASYSGPKSLQTSRGSKNQKEKKPVLAQLLRKEGLQHIKQEYDFVDDFKRTRFQSKYLVAADAASALFECDRSKAWQRNLTMQDLNHDQQPVSSLSHLWHILRRWQYIENKVGNKAKLWAIIAAQTMLRPGGVAFLLTSVFTRATQTGLRHKVSIVVANILSRQQI